jgi:hypothetical protein
MASANIGGMHIGCVVIRDGRSPSEASGLPVRASARPHRSAWRARPAGLGLI